MPNGLIRFFWKMTQIAFIGDMLINFVIHWLPRWLTRPRCRAFYGNDFGFYIQCRTDGLWWDTVKYMYEYVGKKADIWIFSQEYLDETYRNCIVQNNKRLDEIEESRQH